jgi:hypothetical protein
MKKSKRIPRDLDACELPLGYNIVDPEGRMTAWHGKSDPLFTIPMILNCPGCGERHIDEGEFVYVPHHTHACQGCGLVWRPAKINTHGVQFLPGYKNGDD